MTEQIDLDRKAALASLAGIEPDRVHIVNMELDVLFKQGLLIDLSISGTSMFTRQASWAELGIPQDSEDTRYTQLTRGQKFLNREERIKKLRSVETRARQWLDRLSYDVTGFRPYRYLPFTAYEKWVQKWEELVAEFNQVKVEFLDNYDEDVAYIAETFQGVAAHAWTSLTKNGAYSYAIVDGRPMDRDQFIDHVVANACAKMPSRHKIINDLKIDYITALVYGKAAAAEDLAKAEQINRERQQARIAADEASRVAHLQSSLLQEQLEHQARIDRIEAEEREAKIEAMRQAEGAHARQQLAEIASPFQEVFSALRRQISEDATEMLASIQKNGSVRGKVAERGRGLLALFDLMAIQGDSNLRQKLVELRQAIGPIGSEREEVYSTRSTSQVVSILEQIREMEREAVAEMLAAPSRASLVEI